MVNVCGLFRRRVMAGRGSALLVNYLRAAGLEALGDRLAAASVDAESFCAVAALDFDRRVSFTDRVCLGDASAMIPPFTGNGMAMAFQSAELALSPLLNYARDAADWRETCRITNAALRDRFRLRLASAGALHPFLLQPRRQRWFAALSRARLLPFGPLYATLH
jgi:2-polyprenyl-6-methoxyphenol hydroxylase-like FAD-dependent oxidoreductase